jgi:short-subunit dehydrogenase
MSGLKGTAVVTGATGGVGALYAAGLAERGYDLLLVGRQQKALDALAKAIKQKVNVKVETLVANLAEAKDLARVEGADIKRSRDRRADQQRSRGKLRPVRQAEFRSGG